MTALITAVESKSMRGRYEVTIRRSQHARPYTYDHLRGHEEAAAKCVALAIGCSGAYQILGCKKVQDEILKGGITGNSGN